MQPFVDPLCPESLLQFIWLSGRFNMEGLATATGEPLEILHPGQLNRHAGPDFTAARIRIGSLLWAGNVEVHYRTSDWKRHGHQHDPRYDRVILHVVFEHDGPRTAFLCWSCSPVCPRSSFGAIMPSWPTPKICPVPGCWHGCPTACGTTGWPASPCCG